jgi:hypothetical protein
MTWKCSQATTYQVDEELICCQRKKLEALVINFGIFFPDVLEL